MPGWRILVWAVLVIAALYFVFLVRGVLLPFIVSFIIAALLEPTVRRLRLRGFSRPVSVFSVLSAFYAFVIVLGVLVTPLVTRETTRLTDKVQELTTTFTTQGESDNFFLRWDPVTQLQAGNTAEGQIDQILARYSGTLERLGLPSTRREIMEQYVDKNRPQITKAVQDYSNAAFGFLAGMFSHVFELILIPILIPLILADMDNLRRRGPRWIPPAIRASTMGILSDIGQVFVKYLRGISTVVLIYAAVMTFYLWLMGVPSWILLGPLFAFLYLIPYIGNIISALTVLTIVGFSGVTGGLFHPFPSAWTYGILVMCLYFVIGAVFDHLIYPQLVGNSVGLSPVVSIFVIVCGGALFGLPGMIVAFPLAGSVKVILDRLIRVTSTSAEGLGLPSVPLRHRTA